ncbi:bifunctional 2-polyprenyl-6-hydroxyphenol methylase/3-demethylubiquinol 3-O-methyltransferase UbiG [Deinococcus sp. 12RED42]|uniref:class I SAM-dependent methyltransferase n=1 Tax=Deinococcus sp. 12RED42 TaxID=2745872 RepID=UPI001E29FD88|nr:class I SAM-dependent methyltransferase [Deinococcus sp. 12RED42]MCD0166407.1 class I SAM-dependent methyltransferase [Deinococcus sp. 12RED42]
MSIPPPPTAGWVVPFYDLQDRLIGCYSAPLHAAHVEAARRLRGQYPQANRLLELGAGGGQFAVSAAAEGFTVTALELRAAGVEHTLRLAREHGVTLSAVQGDFYAADPGGPFDLIVYWDGFGVGSDDDQRRLLTRISGWLAPQGHVLLDIYTPWYWASHAGYTRRTDTYTQVYGFDRASGRMTDTYMEPGGQRHTQSLRCYSPDDLRRLLASTGLRLARAEPGGMFDTGTGTWHPQADWASCMTFQAALVPE